MELRLRRRQPTETLSALHQDIKRLIALAHPALSQEAREAVACDYFIDALDDPDFALKIRERSPALLDEALRAALRLEAWMKDSQHSRGKPTVRMTNSADRADRKLSSTAAYVSLKPSFGSIK
jgi:hypothetical protein